MNTSIRAKGTPSVGAMTTMLRGLGQYDTHFDSHWLYLPGGFCRSLGDLRRDDFVAAPFDGKRLFIFLASHWVPFWRMLEIGYGLDVRTIAILQRRPKTVTHRVQKLKVRGKTYVREYWVIQAKLVDSLDFPNNDLDAEARQARSLNRPSEGSHQCQISPVEFFFEVTPGRTPGYLPPVVLVGGTKLDQPAGAGFSPSVCPLILGDWRKFSGFSHLTATKA